jgi:hypothetical protein
MGGDPATRRDFLRLTKAAGAGLALAGAALPALANDPRKEQDKEAELGIYELSQFTPKV